MSRPPLAYFTTTLLLILLILLPDLISAALATADSKRGLDFIPSTEYPEDSKIWLSDSSTSSIAGLPGPKQNTLRWYYNYKTQPDAAIKSKKVGDGEYAEDGTLEVEFVPMLWGDYDNSFVEDVRALKREGYVIKSVYLNLNQVESLEPFSCQPPWVKGRGGN